MSDKKFETPGTHSIAEIIIDPQNQKRSLFLARSHGPLPGQDPIAFWQNIKDEAEAELALWDGKFEATLNRLHTLKLRLQKKVEKCDVKIKIIGSGDSSKKVDILERYQISGKILDRAVEIFMNESPEQSIIFLRMAVTDFSQETGLEIMIGLEAEIARRDKVRRARVERLKERPKLEDKVKKVQAKAEKMSRIAQKMADKARNNAAIKLTDDIG